MISVMAADMPAGDLGYGYGKVLTTDTVLWTTSAWRLSTATTPRLTVSAQHQRLPDLPGSATKIGCSYARRLIVGRSSQARLTRGTTQRGSAATRSGISTALRRRAVPRDRFIRRASTENSDLSADSWRMGPG